MEHALHRNAETRMSSAQQPWQGVVLSAPWFGRPTAVVAADLVGCLLCRALPDGQVLRARISETEAYLGAVDAACHARNYRRTARTEPMFAAGGVCYVYFTYGLHHLLNLVTSVEGEPEAVLIRAAFLQDGDARLLAGPAKLTKALHIDRTLTAQAIAPSTGLWVEQDDCRPPIMLRPRIGIDYAGEAKDWLLRCVWAGHPSLSKK